MKIRQITSGFHYVGKWICLLLYKNSRQKKNMYVWKRKSHCNSTWKWNFHSLFLSHILFHSLSLSFFTLLSYDSKATYDPSWRTDLCITENLMENITRCICPISGTFVVLMVKKSFNVRKFHYCVIYLCLSIYLSYLSSWHFLSPLFHIIEMHE